MSVTRGIWSIRSLLLSFPAVITVLILFIGLFVWLLNYSTTRTSIGSLSGQLQRELTTRVVEKCGSLLGVPPLLVDVVISNHDQGLMNLSSFDQVNERFMKDYFFSFPQISFLVISSASEHMYGYERIPNGTHYLYRSDESTGFNRLAYQLTNETGEPITGWGPVAIRTGYRPTKRDWYKYALQAGKETWTNIYPFADGTLGVSRAGLFLNETGDVVGVTTADLALGGLDQFMRSVKVPTGGKAYLVEQSGLLVASSSGVVSDPVKGYRTAAVNSTDRYIAIVSQNLMKKYGSFSQVFSKNGYADQVSEEMIIDSQKYFVQLAFVPDEQLRWIVVIVIPERSVMSKVNTSTKISMSITAVVIALALIISLVGSVWFGLIITKPLASVSDQMNKIATMDFDESSKSSLSYLAEFSQISKALKSMKAGLAQFKKFVPRGLMNAMKLSNVQDAQIGSSSTARLVLLQVEVREVASLLKSGKDTTQGIEVLTNFIQSVSEAVKKQKGFIVRYMGNGLIAGFKSQTDAFELVQEIHKIKIRRYEFLKFVCAACTGDVTAMTTGDEDEVGVVLLSEIIPRLQFMIRNAKLYGVELVVTQDDIAHKSLSTFTSRPIGTFIHNDQSSTVLHEIIIDDKLKVDMRDSFIQAQKVLFGVNEIGHTLFDALRNLEAITLNNKQDMLAASLYRQCLRNAEKNERIMGSITVLDCLSDVKLLEGFEKYCHQNRTCENILLWKDIENFKRKSGNSRRKTAKEIYDEYIEASSHKAVNINHSSIQQIASVIQDEDKEIAQDLFDSLQKELKFVMTDSFRRFKDSDSFRAAFEQSSFRIVPKHQVYDEIW